MTDVKAYRQARDHWRHCPGEPEAEHWKYYRRRRGDEIKRTARQTWARVQSDLAWTVMLCRQGLIPADKAARILSVLRTADESTPFAVEQWISRETGDEDLGSVVNLGRTLQEPMSRLQLREKMLDVLAIAMKTLGVVLDEADKHAETIMVGQTHVSHAQPTTYAAHLLGTHDALARAFELLELAYAHIDQNTGGCGAMSGTGWPVDRELVTELLGFEKTVELAYDCETGQDHAMTTLYALNSVTTILSRVAMDYNIWGMEEVGMMRPSADWCGVSSLMPQKCIPGSQFERIRIAGANVAGQMMRGLMGIDKEPNQDMLPIYEAWRGALEAMCQTELALGFFMGLLPSLVVDRDRMLEYAREGYAATPDLAIKLIRDHGYGPRRAHSICACFVRLARERGVKAYEATGALLDEGAKENGAQPPGLTDDEVREALDPAAFIARHNNLGDPHPDESRRMIGLRREQLAELENRHAARLARIEQAAARLAQEIDAIVSA